MYTISYDVLMMIPPFNTNILTKKKDLHNIELIDKTKLNQKASNFDYINIYHIKINNNIKNLYLFRIVDNNKIYKNNDIFEDFETEKILNYYTDYYKSIKKYIKYDECYSDDTFIYNNFCNSIIKLNINDLNFYNEINIPKVIIKVPLSPK